MWGEHSPQFQQKHEATFTESDTESFIPVETIRSCMDNPPAFQSGRCASFIDWSGGGDETAIANATGNRIRIIATFREHDAVQCVRRVAALLKKEGLVSGVSADVGGIGAPMTAQLCSDFGIYAARINNGSPARKKDEYANADAERWFAFRRMLEKRQLILPSCGELLKQLSSRRLQYDSKARIQLEPKESMRARGLSSPDRADAVVGCACAGYASGAVRAEDLGKIKFGGPSGWNLFGDFEPVVFG